MQHIFTSSDLKNAIHLLEIEQEIKLHLLKEQFYLSLDSLKPVNNYRSILKDTVSFPNLLNIIRSIIGLSTGSIAQNIITGVSANIFGNLFESVFRYIKLKYSSKKMNSEAL